MATPLNLGPYQRGDTKPLVFTFDDGVSAIDMRGKTITFSVKVAAAQADTEAVLVLAVTPDALDTAAQGGTVTLVLEHSDTIGMYIGLDYSYSLRISEPASPEPKETTYIVGTFTLDDA
jgi:hypothetical protein